VRREAHDELAVHLGDADVERLRVVELAGIEVQDAMPVGLCDLDGAVGRAAVDDEDVQCEASPLARQRVEAPADQLALVERSDDDSDQEAAARSRTGSVEISVGASGSTDFRR
jgi:hypothetical protein